MSRSGTPLEDYKPTTLDGSSFETLSAWEKKESSVSLSESQKIDTAIPLLAKPASSNNRQNAKQKWKRAVNIVRSNIRLDNAAVPLLGLSSLDYHLEKLDPQHRNCKKLMNEFHIWERSNTIENFFPWLDRKEEETGIYLPRMVYREIKQEQTNIFVHQVEDKLFIKNWLCDTRAFKGKMPGYAAFVLSENNELFLTEHKISSDVHASLLGGKRVACAGMVRIENGKITDITNFSGHYTPGLKNLFYAVKKIPAHCFSEDARIIYREPLAITKQLKGNKYATIRALGQWANKKALKKTMSRHDFIHFAEKQLEKIEKKFIHKRDKKGNRYENTFYESHLSKIIIENDKTWRPLLLKINEWIYNEIFNNKDNDKMIKLVIAFLNKNTQETVKKENCLEVLKQYLIESKNLAPTVKFHSQFFEYILAVINKENAYNYLPSYKTIRSDNLFHSQNRGVSATTDFGRGFARFKHFLYHSNALGIMPDEETPDNLSEYFGNSPGNHIPSKRFYNLNGERPSYVTAQRNRDSKMEIPITFREEALQRDISIISGTSGTTAKIIAPLIDVVGLTPLEVKDYLMVLGAAIVAYGHHSMYETMVLARNLGFNIEYNHRFYHEQFITDAFRESEEYKKFLNSYGDSVNERIEKPSINENITHASYINIKRRENLNRINPNALRQADDVQRFLDNKKLVSLQNTFSNYYNNGHTNTKRMKLEIVADVKDLLLILMKNINADNSREYMDSLFKAASADLKDLARKNVQSEKNSWFHYTCFFKGKNRMEELLKNAIEQIDALRANYSVVKNKR